MRAGCAWFIAGLMVAVCFTTAKGAAWHDSASAYRRRIVVQGDAQQIKGEELAHVRFMGNGSQKADASDVRITTALGKPVASRVVTAGPGDGIDLVFNTIAGESEYLAYFACEKPRIAPDENLARGGLLLELKPVVFDGLNSPKEMEDAWNRLSGTKAIGQQLLARPHLGMNLSGQQGQFISKVTGRLQVPRDGTYVFAVAADDRGALFIDGKPLVFCRYPVGDARFQERLNLTQGWHDFLFYHADAGGEYSFSIAWKRPNSQKFEVIAPESFGTVLPAKAGPLEAPNKTVTADMEVTYLGEWFFANNYSHRLRFSFVSSFRQPERVQCRWDFGDGQRGQGQQIEHVYLAPGLYTVSVEGRLGGQTDRQSFRLRVDRDWKRSNNPPTDQWGVHSGMVAGYDLNALTPDLLPWATILHTRANDLDAAIATATALARAPHHSNGKIATQALQELRDALVEKKNPSRISEVLGAVPHESDLNPWATREYAEVLAYAVGDFAKAAQVLQPLAEADDATRRTYGQVLVLAGRADEGRRRLEALPVAAAPQKATAISGAMARTTEFYVQEKDAEGGERAWDKWMAAFPADFMDGNAVDMRVKLIAARQNPAVAARVAEAFANAVPQSAYAPRLLDTASRLLEQPDPAKSKSLRQLLKQRYPEDPLSQK